MRKSTLSPFKRILGVGFDVCYFWDGILATTCYPPFSILQWLDQSGKGRIFWPAFNVLRHLFNCPDPPDKLAYRGSATVLICLVSQFIARVPEGDLQIGAI